MNDLVALIKDLGFPAAIAVYLLYRDWKFMNAIVTLMSRLDAFLDAKGVPDVKADASPLGAQVPKVG